MAAQRAPRQRPALAIRTQAALHGCAGAGSDSPRPTHGAAQRRRAVTMVRRSGPRQRCPPAVVLALLARTSLPPLVLQPLCAGSCAGCLTRSTSSPLGGQCEVRAGCLPTSVPPASASLSLSSASFTHTLVQFYSTLFYRMQPALRPLPAPPTRPASPPQATTSYR
jgi:hypothetical protein